METYKVYKHTSPCGKVYIGITKRSVRGRWANGAGYRYNKYFSRAIQKYGWDNFKHEVLFENLTEEEACQKEIELISEYQATNPEFGYNIFLGGQKGAEGLHLSEETRLKMSKTKKGKPNLKLRGHKRSDEFKQRLSQNNGMHTEIGYKNWYEATHTKEYIEKLRTAALNMSDETKHKISVTMGKPVAQYDLNNNLLSTYYSIKEASKCTGISVNSIRFGCNNQIKNPRQYIWKFIDKE